MEAVATVKGAKNKFLKKNKKSTGQPRGTVIVYVKWKAHPTYECAF